MDRKIDKLRAMMAAEDWHGALRLAAKFPRLGKHKAEIERGYAALQWPEFYAEMDRDPELLVRVGVEALKERYGN